MCLITALPLVSDNIRGMRDLVLYAYKMGHRRIAYIHGEDGSEVTKAETGVVLQNA